MAKISHWM